MDTKKIKVVFLVNSLAGGGAERVLSNILKNIDKNVFNPYLILLKKEGELLSELPSDINLVELGMKSYSLSKEFFFLLFKLFKLIKQIKPDVCISFLWESNIILLSTCLLSKDTKAIISERIAPLSYFQDILRKSLKVSIAKFITKNIYKMAFFIICVSYGIRDELVELGINPKKLKVIYNPLDINKIKHLSYEEISYPKKYILFAGRLHKQKNIPLLIKAFSQVKDFYNGNLVIIGKGKEEENLKNLVREMQLTERVDFLGFQTNPYKWMKNADIFILPSNYEGFPGVLLEAMVCGVPVISTDCPYGPKEIIDNEVNGILIPTDNVTALVEAIKKLLFNGELREKLVLNGFQKAIKFDISKVIKDYEEILIKAVKG
ncbi:glycosyltransferase [Thermodesulfovibrio hydrogeniphilus]